MKRLVSIIFVILFVLVSVNSVFSETIGPNKEWDEQAEKQCSAYKNNPVVKEGLLKFNKQFLDSFIYFRKYPNMAEQSVENPRFDWMATFRVRHILTLALADPKSNVRVINWKNYQGFSIQNDDGEESLGLLFDVDGNSSFLSDYIYIGGKIQKASAGEIVLVMKTTLSTYAICAKRAEKALKP